MIETKVPMDLRRFKSKLIGPFTTRQVVCVALAAGADAALVAASFGVLHTGITFVVYLLIFVDIPILSFCVEVLGMPMEQYLRQVLLRALLVPTARRAEHRILMTARPAPAAGGKKRRRRERAAARKDPKFQAYL